MLSHIPNLTVWSLVLAALLFALFLELLGWFTFIGLFMTACEYIPPLAYITATHEGFEVIYLLLIIRPTIRPLMLNISTFNMLVTFIKPSKPSFEGHLNLAVFTRRCSI